MKITYLRLEKYKRFPLSNIEIFEKEFASKLTMIVGANGVGKSSLISELTPSPANKDNFYKGGYKELHIDHNNKTYRLISDFRDHSKFIFYCDDENLNLSGNVTMQKELVYQHFGITAAIHDLLTGKENFTDMSLLGRKKLFHAITHLNIDTILSNYEKLKEELKNNEFLHKTLTTQLVLERHKLSDTNALQTLKQKVSSYQQHIENLLTIRQEIYRFSHGSSIEESSLGLKNLETKKSDFYKQNYIYFVSQPYNSLSARLQEKQNKLIGLDSHLKSLYESLSKLLDEKKTLSLTNSKNIDELQVEYDYLSVGIQNRLNSITVFRDLNANVTNLIGTLSVLQILETSLPEILETLPVNENRKYSKQAYVEATESKSQILEALNKLLQDYNQHTAELRELEKHKRLDCPNCHHNWLPAEVDGRITDLRTKLSNIEKEQAENGEKLKHIQLNIEEQSSYLSQLQLVMNLYTSTKTSIPQFWNIVSEKSLLHNDPSSILLLVRKAISDCETYKNISELQNRQTEIKDLIDRIKKLTHTNESSIDTEILTVEEVIYQEQCSQDVVRTEIADIKYAISVYATMLKLQSAIDLATSDLQEANTKHLAQELMKEIDTDLSLTKVSLLELEREISKQSMTESNVLKLEAQLEEVNEHVKVLKILTDELSPKNGFIAKTISNFLNVIINSINSVIAGVWDYKMILKPINIEEDPLNYKFKVEVEDRLVIDDISSISSGMKEIVNLAMKITLYKLLRLDNYPIYLDEYGVKLDQMHRSKITDIIFKMINSNVYSQIFLITHIDMAFSYFKDTEVLEL